MKLHKPEVAHGRVREIREFAIGIKTGLAHASFEAT